MNNTKSTTAVETLTSTLEKIREARVNEDKSFKAALENLYAEHRKMVKSLQAQRKSAWEKYAEDRKAESEAKAAAKKTAAEETSVEEPSAEETTPAFTEETIVTEEANKKTAKKKNKSSNKSVVILDKEVGE